MQRIAELPSAPSFEQIPEHWQATDCHADSPSPWSMDQHIWRIWTALHFLPLKITQQGNIHKNDLKKIASVLKEEKLDLIELFISSMLKTELIKQQNGLLKPCPIDWPTWSKTLRTGMLKIIRGWERWQNHDEKQVLDLLISLPTGCWLKLDEIVEHLQSHSSDKLISANWMHLFTAHQHMALHHLNISQRTIYLLPEFQAVLKQQPVCFASAGWYGADEQARVMGFISATGEIQLPPDCNHAVLHQLAAFCRITSIEQMITLQLDQQALQRIGTDKTALEEIRALLESLQSPLPQAVNYMFDKQLSQQPVAAVAAAAMVFVLHDASAIHRLRKTGFDFSQPFQDKPEIVLLDASADAHALMKACSEAGILLDTLIKPVDWITGMASINAWMQVNLDREDQWLEISYQKSLSSAPKQLFARIDADYYGAIRIQPTRKIKQAYQLQKTTLQLSPKQVLRLRELDDAEVIEFGLDQLS